MAVKRSAVRTHQRAKRANDAAAKAIKKAQNTQDSFQNFALNLGLGTNNLLSNSTYGFNPITRQKVLLEFMHRGNWLAQIAVDALADDMTRAGVELKGELQPNDIEKIEESAVGLGVWDSINDAIKWARLYGGSIAFMMIDGQDPSAPLQIDAIAKGSFKGLLVFDRWMIDPSLNDLVTEPGPYLGLPKYYTTVSDAPAIPRMRIHYSRCLRLEGCRVPYWQRVSENLWGISVIEPLYDRMVAFDAATTGASQLIHKSFLRTLRLDGLRSAVATGGIALQGVLQQVHLMRQMQQNEGITMVDGKDEFHIDSSAGYAGIADVLIQFGQQIAGALQIPLVRLFGQSPMGLNSTGASDIRTYYDGIKQKQVKELKVDVTRIYRVLAFSLGVPLPKGFGIDFRSLWQLSEDQRAATSNTIVSAISTAFNEGIITKSIALKELRQSADDTGIFSNISENDIAMAELEALAPPSASEALSVTDPGAAHAAIPGSPPGATGPLPHAPSPVVAKPAPVAATPLKGPPQPKPATEEPPDSNDAGARKAAILPFPRSHSRDDEILDTSIIDEFVAQPGALEQLDNDDYILVHNWLSIDADHG
jgi:phage-related protein (TIGR01555 family)